MTPEEITRQAEIVFASVQGLSQREAIVVLARAMTIVTTKYVQGHDSLDEPCPMSNKLFLRRRPGGTGIISSNPKMRAYIHGLNGEYVTIEGIRHLLVEKFGEALAPSKSSIHRYLQKIAKAEGASQGVNQK